MELIELIQVQLLLKQLYKNCSRSINHTVYKGEGKRDPKREGKTIYPPVFNPSVYAAFSAKRDSGRVNVEQFNTTPFWRICHSPASNMRICNALNFTAWFVPKCAPQNIITLSVFPSKKQLNLEKKHYFCKKLTMRPKLFFIVLEFKVKQRFISPSVEGHFKRIHRLFKIYAHCEVCIPKFVFHSIRFIV